ncbi:MAG: MFS transporter [Rubrivivax sp.]
MSGPTADAAPAGRMLAGLLVLAAVVGTVNGLSRVAMPLFAASLGAQAWQVGLVGGLGYAGMLTLALPMGAWIDRHGSRTMFSRGVVLAVLGYAAMTLVQQPWQAVLGAALLGLVLPMRVIPSHTEFLALLPRLSATRAGWNRGANTVGMFFVGPALSAAVIAAAGFRAVFTVAAAGLALAFAVGRRVLQGPPDARPAAPADDGLLPRVRAQLRLVAGHAPLQRTMAIDFLTQLAVAYFVVFAIILATRRFGMPLQAAAGLVTLQGATYVGVLLFGGALVMRWDEERRYTLAFVLLALQGLLCGLGGSPAGLWAGAALMGLGMGVQGLTSTTRYAGLMRDHGRGLVGGLGSLAPPAGGVLGAVGGGLVSQRWGTEAGFTALGLAYAGLALLQLPRLRARRVDEGD